MKRRNLLMAGGVSLLVPTALAQMTEGEVPESVILVTSGDYFRYQSVLLATCRALAARGLIENGDVPVPSTTWSTLPMWQWLSRNAGGKRLSFSADGWYSYEWDKLKRLSVREDILNRLKERHDVGLILTFGTDAGVDMARYVDDVPVLNLNSTDPVANGIVQSAADSGKDNVHALVTGDYWQWQLERFHAIFRFRRLAIVCAEENVTRSGIEEARTSAPIFGYQLVLKTFRNEQNQPHESFERFLTVLEEVVDKNHADAVYLPWFPADDAEMQRVVGFLTRRRIPSFAQTGSEPVKRGLLMGAGDVNYDDIGRFEARVIESVINGVAPRKISQKLSQNQGLVLNLRTAMQMGWQPPLGLLATVEKTYATQSPEFTH